MLLSEMVRKISREAVLVNDGSFYRISALSDWTDLVTKTLTLTEPMIIEYEWTARFNAAAGNTAKGNVRMLVDNIPVCSTGDYSSSGTYVAVSKSGWLYLPAGNHTFKFQASMFVLSGSADVGVSDICIRGLKFSDTIGNIQQGQNSVMSGVVATILSGTIQIPKRKLCVGDLKEMFLKMVFCLYGVDQRVSVLKNSGESSSSTRLNWRLYINGSAVDWTSRHGDQDLGDTSNITYGEGAFGYYEIRVKAGDTVNFEVKCHNNGLLTTTCVAVLSFFACPWIFPSGTAEYEPFSLNFPPGSTLYVVLEPLSSDPTKTIKLGYPRAWSLGYDYYSTSSGTGILAWNYTFENVPPSECILKISGGGGCISIIAVDVR
jgi:hypothetical protein